MRFYRELGESSTLRFGLSILFSLPAMLSPVIAVAQTAGQINWGSKQLFIVNRLHPGMQEFFLRIFQDF